MNIELCFQMSPVPIVKQTTENSCIILKFVIHPNVIGYLNYGLTAPYVPWLPGRDFVKGAVELSKATMQDLIRFNKI